MQTMRLCLVAVLAFGLLAIPIIANADDWRPLDGQAVGEGIDYQTFNWWGRTIYVTRMPVGDENYAIEACSAHMTVDLEPDGGTQAPETLDKMVQHYNGIINSYGSVDGNGYWWPAWGDTSEPFAAINGGPHNRSGDEDDTIEVDITRGHIQQGYCAKPLYGEGLSGFIWTGKGTPHIGGCVSYGDQICYYGTGANDYISIARVNGSPATGNEVVMYTPQTLNGKTPNNTTTSVRELVVRCPAPTTLNAGYTATGTVVRLSYYDETPVEFDCVVLSGGGTATATLSSIGVGNTVTIEQTVTNLYTDQQLPGDDNGCATPDTSVPWEMAYSFVGGFTEILRGGDSLDILGPDYAFSWRTAVAYHNDGTGGSDDYVYFVTGRGQSVPMMRSFCQSTLGCTDAIALDCASSTQMWVKSPIGIPFSSADKELKDAGKLYREIPDGLMMCRIHPKETSPGDYHDTEVDEVDYPCRPTLTRTTQVRTGPGSDYPVVETMNVGNSVTIQPHYLNGVRSTNGTYWWYVKTYNSKKGWVNEDAFSHTLVQVVPAKAEPGCGGTATLTVRGQPGQFKGYPYPYNTSFTKQWQKWVYPAWTDLSDTEYKYSGTDTDTLTVMNCQPADMANYRCKLTPSGGGTTLLSETSIIYVICGGG